MVERLCVNRDVPEADCHGRCFLAERQAQEQEQRERQTTALEVMLAGTFPLPPPAADLGAPERDGPDAPLVPERVPAERAGDGPFHPPRGV